MEVIQYQAGLKLPEAVNGVQIAILKKENPSETAKAIQRLIAGLAQSFNLTNTINEVQLLEMSLLILEKYYFLKIEELAYVFKNAKLGQYGKIYNRLDIQIVCEWIEAFLVSDERISFFEKEAKNFKDEEKAGMNESVREIYKKLYDSFIQDQPEQLEVKELKPDIKPIQVRAEDYFNQLKELSPQFSNDELEALKSNFTKSNYVDGINLINKELQERDAV